uniref:Gamma-butyrobetaine dioxygenase n=1 Tax=Acrobeloides nanus TaxID=290746 RepID=A0A914EQT4_9BILA
MTIFLSTLKVSKARLENFRFIASFAQNKENRSLTVHFKDDTSGIYPYVWLRDCSLEPHTYSIAPAMKARIHHMRDFDIDVEPVSIALDAKSSSIKILWPNNLESRYPVGWLKARNLDNRNVRELRRRFYLTDVRTWNAEEIKTRLKKFDHGDVMIDDKALHDFLTAVCVDGIALIKNSPKNNLNAVAELGDRIGLIHQTHFGKVFEVITKADASNMAYASGGELPYHTDFPSLSQPPELQMLHVIKSAQEGGFSKFVDGFRIAELLKKEKPEVFEILTKTTIEYIEEGFDVHDRDGKIHKFDFDMAARHKVLRLDDDGRVIKVQFGNAMRSWFFDVTPEQIPAIYNALKTFTSYCYDPANQFIFKMDDGDTVLWANTRILHARSAYKNSPGRERSLIGCYFMWDIIKSKVRLLRDQLQLPNNQMSV